MTFTSTPPTKPGAYWFRPRASSSAPQYSSLIEVTTLEGDDGSLICFHEGLTKPKLPDGLWSPRLVPEDEVEKAFVEGWNQKHNAVFGNIWHESHAKQVVDGTMS